MKKATIIIIATVVVMLSAWHQSTASAVLSLLVTGHIPGTGWTIPFWAMMAIYCMLITALVTHYVESMLHEHRDRRASAAASRMPRRRYSHI